LKKFVSQRQVGLCRAGNAGAAAAAAVAAATELLLLQTGPVNACQHSAA